MRRWLGTVSLAGALLAMPAALADEKQDLDVLYVGYADTPRGEAFAGLLREAFTRAEAVNKDAFDPAMARDYDVVLLDWSQRDLDYSQGLNVMATLKSPLGPREQWAMPTVLLGSAGLLIASPWQTQGGYG